VDFTLKTIEVIFIFQVVLLRMPSLKKPPRSLGGFDFICGNVPSILLFRRPPALRVPVHEFSENLGLPKRSFALFGFQSGETAE